MKVRNGFVSNSSSSSFIIGLGVVTDLEKFTKACENVGLTVNGKGWSDNVIVRPLSQLLADAAEDKWSEPRVNGTKLEIESFAWSTVELDYSNLDGDTLIASLDTEGELTGDGAFMRDEDDFDLDYDLSPTESDCEKMSVFTEECGIANGTTSAGAGRNG